MLIFCRILQWLYNKYAQVHLHEMDSESFYHFIVLVSSTSNRSGKLNCFNRSSSHIKFRGNSLC